MITSNFRLRIIIIFFILLIGYTLVAVHLFILQTKHSKFFAHAGKNQYALTITQAPPRAIIYDRNNDEIALNTDSFAAFITPNVLKEKKALLAFLKQHFSAAYDRYLKNPDAHFMYVKRRLNKAEMDLIEQAKLLDIQFLKEPSRFYPVEGLGPVLGITNIDNEGISGLELYYHKQLAGSPTTFTLEQEARKSHFYFKKETKISGHLGIPLKLTLDSTLQFLAYEELKEVMHQWEAQEGSVIIMDPTNGDILVMANYPDFDPNNPLDEVDPDQTKNKIITNVYEFGSVMKVFPAIAALEEKVVTPDEIIDCENVKTAFINGIKINTWKAHGLLTYAEVIELSNNIGTAKVTMRLGPKLYEHYKKFGFGKKTGIKFPGEQAGFINHPKHWSKQSPMSLSFGYEINATLLQLACAYCMIARHGIPVQPRLIYSDEQPPLIAPRYSAEIMNTIHEILAKTITDGTAHRAQINGYLVKGKTGTANLLENGIYNKDRNIFTFAALVQKDSYQRVIVVFIKEINKKNVYASLVAVPLFEKIAQKMLIHDKVL